jgi:predicted Zn-dependent peptidase
VLRIRTFCVGWLELACVVLAGCHPSAPSLTRARGESLEPRLSFARSGSTSIATLVRPTPGVVRLSLWLDAGARDAQPVQVATLAAWIAAEHAGREATATVYPDATEITLPCKSDALGSCVKALRAALTRREPTEAEAQRARLRLQDGRRRALAADPGRAADELAMRALLGEGATGFFPLGAAENDARSSRQALAAFLGDHYGPERALLVAAGDADPGRVQAAVAAGFAHAAQARLPRAQRGVAAAAQPALQLTIADRDTVSVALAASDLSSAYAYVAQLQTTLAHGGDDAAMRVRGSVFEARGGAIAVLRMTGAALLPSLDHSVRELGRLQSEPPVPQAVPSGSEDLATLSRRLGSDFATRGAGSAARMSFAIGALADGGRADRPRLKDPDAAERSRRTQDLQRVFEQAVGSAHPRLRGDSDEHASSVVMDNAVRIDVRKTSSQRVAIAVRIALGAGEDPPALHGRSALLAELTSTACAGLSADQLGSELARLNATLTPEIAAGSYGLLLVAASAQWQPALDLALRCARAPSMQPTAFAQAAIRLQQRLRASRTDPALRAQLAAAVAPRAPGLYAPLGSPERLGNVGQRELAELLPSARSGARWAVAIVGPVMVSDATARVARRLATLPTGSVASPASPGEVDAGATTTVVPGSASVEGVTGLAVWTTHTTSATSPVAARLTASALQQLLVHAGLQPLSHAGDAGSWGAVAAVHLRVPPELLPALPSLLREAMRRLDAPTLKDALERALLVEQTRWAAAGSRVEVRADRLARERLGDGEPDLSLDAALRQLELLQHATPQWQPTD